MFSYYIYKMYFWFIFNIYTYGYFYKFIAG